MNGEVLHQQMGKLFKIIGQICGNRKSCYQSMYSKIGFYFFLFNNIELRWDAGFEPGSTLCAFSLTVTIQSHHIPILVTISPS